eukprot:GHRQ01014480.1.p1 GENE.GHRQ01014480.1~~GHRQ01014480.1.p1  ORF type:complete len:206 (+),score=52.37 GHRQ01014480.1:592-1209(+)
MSEVAVAAAAFDEDLGRALCALPPPPAANQHGAVLVHQQAARKLHELCDYYVSRKLPPYAFAARLLSAGADLMAKGEHALASSCCFSTLVQLNLPEVQAVSKLDAVARLSLHVKALYGLHSSSAAAALQRDPCITHASTLQVVLAALAGIQAGCMQAVQQQQLYWLVYNATIHIHKAAQPLVTAGFYAEAVPYYVFAGGRALHSC